MQVVGNSAGAQRADRVSVLRCWLRAALDSGCRAATAELTLQLASCRVFDAMALAGVDLVRGRQS